MSRKFVLRCLTTFYIRHKGSSEYGLRYEGDTDNRRLTTGISSEKCVVRRFRLCANVYLHKPR
jgi:hypothetical protein